MYLHAYTQVCRPSYILYSTLVNVRLDRCVAMHSPSMRLETCGPADVPWARSQGELYARIAKLPIEETGSDCASRRKVEEDF